MGQNSLVVCHKTINMIYTSKLPWFKAVVCNGKLLSVVLRSPTPAPGLFQVIKDGEAAPEHLNLQVSHVRVAEGAQATFQVLIPTAASPAKQNKSCKSSFSRGRPSCLLEVRLWRAEEGRGWDVCGWLHSKSSLLLLPPPPLPQSWFNATLNCRHTNPLAAYWDANTLL